MNLDNRQIIPGSVTFVISLLVLFAIGELAYLYAVQNELPALTKTIFTVVLLSMLAGLALISFLINQSINNRVLNPLNQIARAFSDKSQKIEVSSLPDHSVSVVKDLALAFHNFQSTNAQNQSENSHHVSRDKLTSLPGRELFLEMLDMLIKQHKRNKNTFSLLTLDINRFKEINDSLGHIVGDALLKEASERLINLLREMDTIARLGDDEFAIILSNISVEHTEKVVEKIVNVFALPFFIGEHQLLISISIGIARYPEHAEDISDLIRRSNVAMNTAKVQHFPYSFYDAANDDNHIKDLSLSSELREAITKNQLQLFYQPKYSIKENRVVEAEALLRWIHPEKGFIPPDQIIHAAEGSGLIHPLTDWVVETAIKQQREWRNKQIDIGIAVNLSVYNLQNPHLVHLIEFFMSECETSSDKLILEVTESAMMQNPTQASEILSTLDNMNIKIAIDDFGTGYSSLAYLKNLPVDELKIDKSFVMNLKDDDNDLAIVRSTIDLAHNLNLSVVAEGVENDESWNLLEQMGCDLIQGFHLSKPQPPREFEAWYWDFLEKGRRAS